MTAPPPGSHGRRRVGRVVDLGWRVVVASLATGVAFAIDREVFAPIALLFVLVAPFEKLYPRKKGQKLRRPMLGTDLTFALTAPLLNAVAVVVGSVIAVTSLMWIPGLLFRPVVAALPTQLLPLVAFVVFDFLVYWAHRWAHEVPSLWRFHAVHHAPEHMDWISGFRGHPFDGVIVAPAFVFLVAAGIDLEVAGVLTVVQLLLGLFFHANVRLRLRWLDKIACNPEFHHWHHANESDAIGHNYGGALPLWDLLFGTFFMPSDDRRPEHYGVDEPMPRTLIGLLTHPLRGFGRHVHLLWHPVRAVRATWRAVRSLFRQVWAVSTRPTHSVRRQTARGSWSTNSTLFDPETAPGVPPVRVF